MHASRGPVALVLVSLALLFAQPRGALAAKPAVEVVDIAADEVVCDVPVTTHITGTIRTHIIYYVTDPSNAQYIWYGRQQVNLTLSWTNAAGVTLTNQANQTVKDMEIVDLGDGTWQFTYAVVGLPLKLVGPSGTVLMDVGRIVFRDTWFLGDLNDEGDDQFLNGEILAINGPHPQAESDFTLFCQVFAEVLG